MSDIVRSLRAALAVLAILSTPASAAPIGTPSVDSSPYYPTFAHERSLNDQEYDFFERLSRMHIEGTADLNWRNVGPREPQFETQIQDEVFLADMFFGIDGPFIDGVPVQFEWNMPTSQNGAILLNQLNFSYKRLDNWTFQFGKFVLPFGRYNELYRPDSFLTATRPLLYASPDSLDLVIRTNSPRPAMTAGYTDIGARVSCYPSLDRVWAPQELTLYVVNGMGEQPNRVRTFPTEQLLGVPSVGGGGTEIDWGHLNNNLADNNNNKSLGARIVYGLGDIRFPWPIPEGASDLKGMTMGLSATGGQYSLEENLSYQIYGLDWSFDYLGFNVSGEYVWESNQFLAPLESSISPTAPPSQIKDFEIDRGYFVQGSFPILRTPPIGERLTGILVFNQMWRRGPELDLMLNPVINGTTFLSVNAFDPALGRVTTRIDKYTAAMNYQLTDHFYLKLEYSYWYMKRATTPPTFPPNHTSVGNVDIYQTAAAIVMAF